MAARTPSYSAVRIYVAAVSLAAVLVGALASRVTIGHAGPSAGILALFVALLALSEFYSVRFRHYGTVDALNLAEGVIAPLVFFASGVEAVLVVAAALTISQVVGRNQPIKALFNVAQWVLATSVAVLLLDLLRTVSSQGVGQDVYLLMAAVFALAVTNQLALSGVIALTRPPGLRVDNRARTRELFFHHLASCVVGFVAAVCLAAAYRWTPWLIALGAVMIAGVHETARANAALRNDQRRLAAQQRATHHLATALDVEAAMPPFLEGVLEGFELQRAQVVMLDAAPPVTHSYDQTNGYSQVVGAHLLAQHLAETLAAPLHTDSDDPEHGDLIAALGHSRLLAAPLRSGSLTIGMLLLFDRAGLEGFDEGELTIAGALARELVSFLERVGLIDAIEAERRTLADVVNHTGDGILSVDADGTILSWNASMAAITGYTAEEMVGTRHIGLLRPRDSHGNDQHLSGWTSRITGDGLAPELQVMTADGAVVWLSCSYSRIPARDGRRDALIVVARNITQARELELLKDDFVAVVSHELRTPLVPIKGWAQTLLNRGDRLSEDQRRTAVQSILSQAQRLESLVLNILESSRVEAGVQESVEVVDVVSVAARVVEDSITSRPDRVIRLRPPSTPCRVSGSAVWIERAITNLVANAVKYSPDDEPVDVVISTLRGDAVVSVTDRGPGIAPEAQERIFQRFERLEESRKQTGTGLGLYITRRLARGMNGDVTVSSLPGAGSTFILRLPLSGGGRPRLVPGAGAGAGADADADSGADSGVGEPAGSGAAEPAGRARDGGSWGRARAVADALPAPRNQPDAAGIVRRN